MLNKIVIFLLIAHETIAQDAESISCQTAYKEPAVCVKLRECTGLFKQLQKGFQTEELKDYIINSTCNTDYTKEEYICCAERFGPKSLATFNPIDLLPKTSDCGINGLSYVEFGGKEVQIDEHPWIVQLINYNGSYICGGTLMNERYVLAAAHCAVLKGLERVRLGEWYMSINPDCNVKGTGSDDFLEIQIASITIPSSFSTSPHTPDIALIRLKRNVFPRTNIKPVCLPFNNSLRDKQLLDKQVTVIGWEATETGNLRNRKLKAILTIRNRDVCNQKYSRTKMNNNLGTYQLCADGKEGIDISDVDSGDSLVYAPSNGRLENYIVGVTSYGPKKYGQKNWPAVYTHVGAQINWILKTIKP